jgi:Uma2 family endonuclease
MATTAVSIGEYLQDFSYKPDVEYIDGQLRERALAKSVHGLLQTLIGSWFQAHKLEWNVKAGVEIRTRVSPTRVRLPDVIVGPRKKWPQVLTDPPLIVIEILSPGDSYSDTRALALDYHAMGIENIWLIDPETRTSEMHGNGSWLEATRLQVQNSPIYLDMREIFATLDEDNGEDEGN